MKEKRQSSKSVKISCPNCIDSKVIFMFNSNKFKIFFCKKCLNGFTYPVPKNISQYYSESYWLSKGFLGILKNTLYRYFQIRRKYWTIKFLKKGEILDIGSGEGTFSKFMKKDFKVTSLDQPSAQIKNAEVLKLDFLKWRTKRRFDAIVFWESLEHTVSPQKYLKKAVSLLRDDGYIFIEYPRFNSLEARLFKRFWFHLDPPRHLSHLSPNSLDKILIRTKLTRVSHFGVFAPEYTVGGFLGSILNIFILRPNDFFKKSQNSVVLFLLIPLVMLSGLVEVVLFATGQSPIYLTIAQKQKNLSKS